MKFKENSFLIKKVNFFFWLENDKVFYMVLNLYGLFF